MKKVELLSIKVELLSEIVEQHLGKVELLSEIVELHFETREEVQGSMSEPF
ncbi:MAG: hypothetical protein LBT83_07070 [Tannerella sp.]|jgi:hypothetical protein|nr:hypothetical protein [Tannerella sp.]